MFDMDLGTLCLLGIFLIVGVMLFSRMFGGRGGGYGQTGGTDFSERGNIRPTVDSPDVDSQGAFGRDPGASSSRNLRPRSGGIPNLFGGSRRTGGGRVDNPGVKSRGSFGRSKK